MTTKFSYDSRAKYTNLIHIIYTALARKQMSKKAHLRQPGFFVTLKLSPHLSGEVKTARGPEQASPSCNFRDFSVFLLPIQT